LLALAVRYGQRENRTAPGKQNGRLSSRVFSSLSYIPQGKEGGVFFPSLRFFISQKSEYIRFFFIVFVFVVVTVMVMGIGGGVMMVSGN